MIKIAFIISLLTTLGILMVGIGLFLRGGVLYQKYGNALMRWRVIMQGVTLILFFLMFWW
jgi:hypothetical protein